MDIRLFLFRGTMEEEYPDDESTDLERSLEVYEKLDEVIECISGYVEKFRELGYNIGIIVHTYDPLLKESSYVGDIVGDQYAVLGSLYEWLKNQ